MKRTMRICLTLGALLLSPLAMAERDGIAVWFTPLHLKELGPVTNQHYAQECSECHFAYQPGLLPARSWKKLLEGNALADHFGENAELDEATRAEIEQYAIAHAADSSNAKRSRKIMAATPRALTPLRITENSYIKRKHSEIPAALISGNPYVKSLSNCNMCHTQAADGIYDDDTVFIKGHGRWHE